jgi:tetratricopeptide (TPR) repeat protein
VPAALAGETAAWHQDRAWRFLQADDLRMAEREVAQAFRQAPDFFPAETTLGWIAVARGDLPASLPHFDRALALQSGYLSALVGRGRALAGLGRDDEALAAYEAALATDPTLGDLARQVEVLRFRRLERHLAAARDAAKSGRSEEARKAYEAAIAGSPESGVLYRELAVVERDAGESSAALAHFRRAVELDPGDAQSLAQVAALLDTAGDLEGALRAYDESIAIDPRASVEASREALRARIAFAGMPEEYRAIESAPQVTRGDLAALLGVRLARLLNRSISGEASVVTDVRGHWAEAWIMAVVQAGVIEPFENHTFQPDAPLRRTDLAQAVARLLPRVAPAAQVQTWQATRVQFPDLAETHLAYPVASVAVASRVMSPTASGTFDPSGPVNGTDTIAVVERLREMAGTR